jgi:FkbM family methyltransferase
MLKSIIQNGFKTLGYQINKINKGTTLESDDSFTMFGALNRCIKRGLNVNTVVDVGASNGMWSRECLKQLPNSNYLLIEAHEPHREKLEKFKSENKNVNYVLSAAGNREGIIYFENEGMFGGIASETKLEGNFIEVPVIKIDDEIARQQLEGPYLIKLDTHGFEIPILEGAIKTLEKAELVIIETYNYQLTNDSLKFYEMCIYMEEKGFFPIEMADFMLRKFDNSFWQMDTFFVKKDRKEFKYNSYI